MKFFSDRYQILKDIGRGATGRVVAARDLALDRLVAIKFVSIANDPAFMYRFSREATATARLSHPNIVTIFDVGNLSDAAYIVMEYVSGNTLEQLIRSLPADKLPALIPALGHCASALDYAHERGVIHRDIKPSNILIRTNGDPIILDFGIAKSLIGDDTEITQVGTLVGTPMYMAPEQVRGDDIGPQSDQYALAMIAYAILAGRHPFAGAGSVQLIHKIVNDRPARPSAFNPSLPSRVDRALLRALSKEPRARFDSCRHFFEALQGPHTRPERSISSGLVARFKNLFGNIGGSSGQNKPEAGASPSSDSVPSFDSAEEPLVELGRVDLDPVSAVFPEMIRDATGGRPNMIDPTEIISPDDWLARSSSGSRLSPSPEGATGAFTQAFQRPDQTRRLRQVLGARVDPETMARAQSRELVEILGRRDFESAVALRGKWLPGIEGASGELRGFSEAARYLGAAQEAVSAHVRIEHLRRTDRVLVSIGNQLLASASAASLHFPAALEAWKAFARECLDAAEHKALSELPNPFRAGQPLRPDQGRAVFRGRDGLIRNIEAILADAEQNSSVALLGPRRCGKTSLLQMLPVMLPDCVCVFFDLQDNPVSTVPEFFEALSRRASEQAQLQRNITIPKLDAPGTFEAAQRWFDELDQLAGVNRFLISIDEFERLEALFPGDRRDLLRLVGLLRATIQHRRRVRLLVSGVAPFEELGSLWNDHFINVRELRIDHLDERTSIDLLSRPIMEFPSDALPAEVAQRVFERTAGQPYLLQLFGSLLVSRLNGLERLQAVAADVEPVEREALSQGRYYFANIFEDSPAEARRVLEGLAQGQRPEMTSGTRRWLERRCLIDSAGALRAPVLGEYIREHLNG